MSIEYHDAASGKGATPDTGTPPVPPAARLSVILRAALRVWWDRLGLLLAVSVTWACVLSLPLSVERWLPHGAPSVFHVLALALIPVAAAVPTAGAFSLAHRIAAHEEVSYVHLWQDGLRLLGPALRLILVQAGAALILATAFGFYLRMPQWIGRAAVTLCGYALLLWAMMLIYQWPALIAQENGLFDEPEHKAKRGAFAAIRRSFYLALSRPFFTLLLLGVLLLISVMMAATVVLPALFWIGTMALLSTWVTRALLVQYGVLPAPVQKAVVPDELFRLR